MHQQHELKGLLLSEAYMNCIFDLPFNIILGWIFLCIFFLHRGGEGDNSYKSNPSHDHSPRGHHGILRAKNQFQILNSNFSISRVIFEQNARKQTPHNRGVVLGGL